MSRSHGAADPPVAELAAFATIFIWAAYVLFVFVWLLVSWYEADAFVNSVSILTCFDCEGLLSSLERAVSSTTCFGIPLGITGAFAAQAALGVTRHPPRIVVALGLNILVVMAGLAPIILIAMARFVR